MNTVYAMVDATTKRIVYVGCTSNLKARLAVHCSPWNVKNPELAAWLKQFPAGPLVITLHEFEDRAQAEAAEMLHIRTLRPEFNKQVRDLVPIDLFTARQNEASYTYDSEKLLTG